METIAIVFLLISMFVVGVITQASFDAKEIKNLKIKNHKLEGMNYDEKEANSELRYENDELKELLTEVADRSVTCPLNSEKIVLNKIKELVRDYQSQN